MVTLAERESYRCRVPTARARCSRFIEAMRMRAAFVLKCPSAQSALPHAVAVRLECGGLRGLAYAVGASGPGDVHALLTAADERWDDLADLPWADIVDRVAAWHGRRAGGTAS